MTKTQKIALSEKDTVERIRTKYRHPLSSHSFSSLFLWQEEMGLSLYTEEDFFTVRCRLKGENTWFFPCGDPGKTEDFLSRHAGEPDFRLCYVREEDAGLLHTLFPGKWRLVPCPDDDEYIYDIGEQLTLKGGRYANLRTQIHKLEREHTPVVRPLDDETVPDALRILAEWEGREHRFPDSSLTDEAVDLSLLAHRREFSVEGAVLYLDGVPAAVSAGFPLTGDTFDMALSKSSVQLQGLSYYSKREAMKRLFPRFRYLNLEEDLGMPGLRKMKTIMSPIRKNNLWEAISL